MNDALSAAARVWSQSVWPAAIRASRSAPASSSAAITAGFGLNAAAQCKGVSPFLSPVLGFAPDATQVAVTASLAHRPARGAH